MDCNTKKVCGMANSKTVVCGTNILIYLLFGNINAGKIISQYNIAISSMSYIELQVN